MAQATSLCFFLPKAIKARGQTQGLPSGFSPRCWENFGPGQSSFSGLVRLKARPTESVNRIKPYRVEAQGSRQVK